MLDPLLIGTRLILTVELYGFYFYWSCFWSYLSNISTNFLWNTNEHKYLKLLCNNINQKNQWYLVWLLVNSKGDTGDVQFKCNLSIWWCYVIIWEDRRRRSMRLVKLYTVVQNDLLDAFVKYINSNKKSLN